MTPNATATPSRAMAETIAGNEHVAVRATPAAALQRAAEIFLAGEKLDMGALATDLGVARATLYRWTGDRDQLLSDVAWLQVKAIVDYLYARHRGHGAATVERAGGELLSILADNPSLRSFLEIEGDPGLQLLTAPRGGLRPRLVDAVAQVIDSEVEAGNYRPPAESRKLADGIVALGERFLYHGGDPALNPDPETARLVIGLLLREPCAETGAVGT